MLFVRLVLYHFVRCYGLRIDAAFSLAACLCTFIAFSNNSLQTYEFRGLSHQGLLAADAADAMQFETRLKLARYGITPVAHASLKRPTFNHASEQIFANLLDFYRISLGVRAAQLPVTVGQGRQGDGGIHARISTCRNSTCTWNSPP